MKKKKQHAIKNGATVSKSGKTSVAAEKPTDEGWERLMKIREKLGKNPQSEKSSVEILSEMWR
jgi:hypothetical protein